MKIKFDMFVLKQYWGTRGGSFCIYSTGYFEQKLSVVASFIKKEHLMPWYIFSSALNNSFSKCWGKSPLSLLSQNLCLTHICLRIILGFFVYLGGWGCVYIEMVFFLNIYYNKKHFMTMDEPMFLGCHRFQQPQKHFK